MENLRPDAQEVDKSEEILAKAQANKKKIMYCLVVAAVCVIAVLAYLLIAQSGSRKADELVAKADAAQNDSIALTLYAEAADAGYKSGNRAKAEMGIRLYRDGKYEEALKYLDDCSLDDEIAEAGVETLKGDCYVNLDKFPEAIECFSKAADLSDENPMVAPYAMMKEATVQRHLKNYSAEAELYEQITTKYPEYGVSINTNIENYLERAKADAAKK